MRSTLIPGLFLSALLLTSLTARAQQVSTAPDSGERLSRRVEWALGTARRTGNAGFWVGYSISKFMHEDAWIGRIGGPSWGSLKSLYALTGQAHLEEELPAELQKDLTFTSEGVFHMGRHYGEEELFLKEIGVLVYYPSPRNEPAKVRMTNMSLGVDLEDKPLYWLGKSSDEESTAYLRSLFDDSKDEDLRSDLLRAVAMHENRAANFDFLAQVLQSEPSEDIREDAAFWVGQLDLPEGLALLQRVVAGDRSMDVREKAVFGISQMSSKEAQDVLIDLARHEKQTSVRKQAIFWLGQQASQNEIEVLEEIVYDEAQTEVQKLAVHAISQLPADESIPRLIDIARNHPNVAVRKRAIFCLGESGDTRAIDVLIELAKKGR